jgi:hypothetical protein
MRGLISRIRFGRIEVDFWRCDTAYPLDISAYHDFVSIYALTTLFIFSMLLLLFFSDFVILRMLCYPSPAKGSR